MRLGEAKGQGKRLGRKHGRKDDDSVVRAGATLSGWQAERAAVVYWNEITERRPDESVETWHARLHAAQREEIERNNRTAPSYSAYLTDV